MYYLGSANNTAKWLLKIASSIEERLCLARLNKPVKLFVIQVKQTLSEQV